jgi:hypothetical protein
MSDKKISGAAADSGATETSSTAGLSSPAVQAGEAYSGGAAGEAGGAAGHDGGGATGRLKSQADELMRAAQQRAKDIASEQKDAAAAQLGCMARGLRDAAQSMRGESEFAGRYAGKAAEGLERVAQDLEGASFDDLVERTENYARRNPAAFLGGAVAVGFLFARFLKSSRDRGAGHGAVQAYRAPSESSAAASGA